MAESEKMMPREAGKYIATHSKDVTISEEGVKKTAELVCIAPNFIFKKIINFSAIDLFNFIWDCFLQMSMIQKGKQNL